MIDTAEDSRKALRDHVKVSQGEVALVKLSTRKNLIDHLLNESLNTIEGWLTQGPACCLDTISKHEHTSFTSLRLRSRIGKRSSIH